MRCPTGIGGAFNAPHLETPLSRLERDSNACEKLLMNCRKGVKQGSGRRAEGMIERNAPEHQRDP